MGMGIGLWFMSDYKLIERIDDPSERDERGRIDRKFNVSFQPTKALKKKDQAGDAVKEEGPKVEPVNEQSK